MLIREATPILGVVVEKAPVKTEGPQTELWNSAALVWVYFLPGRSSSFVAILTNSASDSACIFRITWPRCILTVISLVPRSKAICLFSIPETTRPMTSRWRAVRAS